MTTATRMRRHEMTLRVNAIQAMVSSKEVDPEDRKALLDEWNILEDELLCSMGQDLPWP